MAPRAVYPGYSKRIRLWDLPDAWIVQLMTCLSSTERQHLFRSSIACRKMVLKHTPNTTLCFPLLEQQSSVAHMLGSLQLASTHSRSIALHMHYGRQDLIVFGRLQVRDIFTNISFAFLKMASGARPEILTANVTTLKLEGACLTTPLPMAVSEACPNLTNLILTDSIFKWDNIPASSLDACFPKLQSWTVDEGTSIEDRKEWQQQLQHQAGQLTSLQSLTLTKWSGYMSGAQAILGGVPAAQLTHLSLSDEVVRDPQHGHWLQSARAACFTLLVHLSIHESTVNDAGLRALLSLPSLEQLEVYEFSLTDSFTNYPVQWQQVSMCEFRLEELTKLPLGNTELQLICVQGADPDIEAVLDITDAQDVAVIIQALSNISRCKGLKWQDMGVRLGEAWQGVESSLNEQLLDKMLLLVAGANSIYLHHIELSQSITQAICKFLRDSPVCSYISLQGSCTWAVLDCVLIMNSMPPDSTLAIECDSETDILKLCCMADKHMILSVMCNLQHSHDEFRKHADAAMRMCGHQHVDLRLW